jgi:hypothetical protein
MTFCDGCTCYSYDDNFKTILQDRRIVRGGCYLCSNPEVIRYSQRAEEPDLNIKIIPIGRACWVCRGHYYTWDGVTGKSEYILILEGCRIQKEQADRKCPIETKEPIKKSPVKSMLKATKSKRVKDPALKRKSRNNQIS